MKITLLEFLEKILLSLKTFDFQDSEFYLVAK